MHDPASDASTLIAKIQRETDEQIRFAALDIEELGGAGALNAYLLNSACNLLGVAVHEQGPDRACELMATVLATAEEIAAGRGL